MNDRANKDRRIYHYAVFLAAIRNPRHPQHVEWMQWVGGKFASETIDLQRANELLQIFQLHVEKG